MSEEHILSIISISRFLPLLPLSVQHWPSSSSQLLHDDDTCWMWKQVMMIHDRWMLESQTHADTRCFTSYAYVSLHLSSSFGLSLTHSHYLELKRKEEDFRMSSTYSYFLSLSFSLPLSSWFRQNEDGQSEPVVISDNIFPLDGCLIIHWTSIQHNTNYICQANNIVEHERSIINLQLDPPVSSLPSTADGVLTIMVNTGESILCTVIVSFHHHIDSSLSPSDLIYNCINHTVVTTANTTTTTANNINSYGKWTHNNHSQRRPVKRSVRIIDDVSSHRSDVNIHLDATLTADVLMSDGQQTNHIVPNLVDIFEEVVAHPKEFVSLRCILNGSPLPQITWSRDGTSLADLLRESSPRLRIADHVTNDGQIIGYLNITRIELNDEGEYKCHGISEAGRVEHSARVSVIGKLRLKTYAIGKEWTNITLIAGRSAIITCPIIGYPIESMKWEHLQQILPVNHRQKIQRLSLKDQRSALQIENVQKHHDEGEEKIPD